MSRQDLERLAIAIKDSNGQPASTGFFVSETHAVTVHHHWDEASPPTIGNTVQALALDNGVPVELTFKVSHESEEHDFVVLQLLTKPKRGWAPLVLPIARGVSAGKCSLYPVSVLHTRRGSSRRVSVRFRETSGEIAILSADESSTTFEFQNANLRTEDSGAIIVLDDRRAILGIFGMHLGVETATRTESPLSSREVSFGDDEDEAPGAAAAASSPADSSSASSAGTGPPSAAADFQRALDAFAERIENGILKRFEERFEKLVRELNRVKQAVSDMDRNRYVVFECLRATVFAQYCGAVEYL